MDGWTEGRGKEGQGDGWIDRGTERERDSGWEGRSE